ncbi:uncharacterized protein [Phaseolus vulgaris]|uniref:uncharacterized protein n=1 Tax=Phaseolus vulgaris TaxID=3885 RepID=UPI0035CC9899
MDLSQNPSSAYYLHPGENPGTMLITTQLDCDNYHTWNRAMKRALLSKNKLKFVNEDLPEPAQNDGLHEAWERCNVMVISWITRTLNAQIARSTVYIDNAKDLWEELRERFSKSNHFRISDLLQEVNSIKQGERSIMEYYTESKILWEELDSLRPIPVCTCSKKCSCKLSTVILEWRESEIVMCFLKDLGEAYNNVKTQILLLEPLPNINRVFSLILQQERQEKQFHETPISETKVLINNASQQTQKPNYRNGGNTGWKNYGRGRGKNYGKQCSYYNKMNHTVDECYSKHGYPPWMKQQRNNYAANAVERVEEIVEKKSPQDKYTNDQIVNSLSTEQLRKIVDILQFSNDKEKSNGNVDPSVQTSEKGNESSVQSFEKGKVCTHFWILDTGATDHVSCDLTLFLSHHEIKPIRIRLPNNTHVIARRAGTVLLSREFMIHNVLK